ncbi:beta-aspartyl-peptidase [Pseudomaricurvus alkylphenolicus]|uniref:beta-aspartyl-peptidase n=1 Tax=Pseudomaricurvus alkylphenolicus TaxID=1306991 RepID=UPI0014214936|nr:beta-aspartyl-peptidase [Pseudomaricurvus alkylphenolicus]NIB41069.1 beta-aspartyl-peptidase [Pseudomaricurvus alkylphenolicus]
MLTLIKNAQLFAPRNLGECDLLVADGRIALIERHIDIGGASLPLKVIDAKGKLLVPGYVDTLVHITGGGGEGGFNSRTPELTLAEAVGAGVTTLVGALGTDADTRSIEDLFGKTKALTEDGLSCYMYTGSYEVPVRTLTGNVRSDLIFLDPVIGVGEIAIADHRGSQPTVQELARIASDANVGGMISGKSGIVMIHVGAGREQLELLHQVHRDFELRLSLFYPTHINRSRALLEAGIEFARKGGSIDFTASTTEHILAMGELRASEALALALEAGVSENQITISSDAQGSLPHFDQAGRLDGLEIGRIGSLHEEWTRAVREHQVSFSTALATVTRNPAKVTGLHRKGEIAVGKDADFNLLEPDSLTIDSVMCRGRWLQHNGKRVAKTAFEHVEVEA